jgi:glycosyltransferase involved in cell wall biosynthesis
MLGACLDSLAFADERLVLVDAATVDRTREIARLHGARVEERGFDNFAAQRDSALQHTLGDWVLFVDADERVSDALAAEVVRSVQQPDGYRGFWIPRQNYLMGRLVLGAGWFPDFQLRLVERRFTHFDPDRPVHELALVDGPVGFLREPLIHFNYASLGEFVTRQERYCRLEAERWRRAYGRPRRRAVLGQPAREFLRRYISLRGYREGGLGLVLSTLLAYYAGKAVFLARQEGAPLSSAAGFACGGSRRTKLGDGGDAADAHHEVTE